MKKQICFVWVSIVVMFGIAASGSAEQMYFATIPVFTDALDFETGETKRDPTIVIVVFHEVGKLEYLLKPAIANLADFSPWPAVDLHVEIDPSTENLFWVTPEYAMEVVRFEAASLDHIDFEVVKDLEFQPIDAGALLAFELEDVLVFKTSALNIFWSIALISCDDMFLLEVKVKELNAIPEPEPASLVLLSLGLLSFMGLVRWKRQGRHIMKRIMMLLLMVAVVGATQAVSARNIKFVDSGQRLGNSTSTNVTLGDLDGDGDLDAVVMNYPSDQANTVWLNDGKGNFTDSGQRLGEFSAGYNVAFEDIDDDGDLDAVVIHAASYPNQIWLNDGTGNFTDSGQILGFGGSCGIALGDVDNDGDLDVFITNHDQGDWVWLNDGMGMFTDSGQNLLGDEYGWGGSDIALGDVDGDGDLDSFITHNYYPNRVWLNDGKGIFSDSGQLLGGNNGSGDVELVDVDGDSDLDALVEQQDAHAVWLNDGTGIFTDSGQKLGRGPMAMGDIDRDGDVDAFFTSDYTTRPGTVWLNDGNGYFIDSGQRLGISYGSGSALADIDNDGDLDVFIANWDDLPNTVWLNQAELLLVLNKGVSIHDPALQILLSSKGITPIPLFDDTRGEVVLKEELGILRTYLLKVASEDPEVLRQQLVDLNAVQLCIYNQAFYFDSYTPQDPYYHDSIESPLWNLQEIGMSEFWASLPAPPAGAGVAVAILDQPLDVQHPDLATSVDVSTGKDCTQIQCAAWDPETNTCTSSRCEEFASDNSELATHGTHIAGIAGAVHNTIGIPGVAGHCQLIPYTIGLGAYAAFDSVFEAIEYAVDAKVDGRYRAVVINLSVSVKLDQLGATAEERTQAVETLHKWIRYAYQSGVPVVTTMGNDGDDILHYPAAYSETIAVGATNNLKSRWTDQDCGSNFGHHLDLVAPGDDVLSTVPQGTGKDFGDKNYDFSTGTSMAAPHVSGALGVLLSAVASNAAEASVTTRTIELLLNKRLTKIAVVKMMEMSCSGIPVYSSR